MNKINNHQSNNESQLDAQQLFNQYRNKSDGIEVVQFKNLCQDLGLLDCSDSYIASIFTAADTDRDGSLNFSEFETILLKITAPTLLDLLTEQHPTEISSLKQSFIRWATFGDRDCLKPYKMSSASWIKLCKDTGLVGKGALTVVHADLIYAKVKSKGQQRITFPQFLDALQLISIKLKSKDNIMDVIHNIIDSEGPSMNGTVINVDKLKNAYTTTMDNNKSNDDENGGSIRYSSVSKSWNSSSNTGSGFLSLKKNRHSRGTSDDGVMSRRNSTGGSSNEFTIPAFR